MLIRLLFILLITSCVFDSSDLIWGLKVPIFLLLILVSIIKGLFSFNNKELFFYILIFSITLPLSSFFFGIILNSENYDDPNLFGAIKPYLFLFLAFSIQKAYRLQEDIIRILAYVLFALSIVILLILIIYLMDLIPWEVLYEFGNKYVLYSVGERSYGAFSIQRVYFHSSPMLVFSLCYFINEYIIKKKNYYIIISLVISASLVLSGTRNNMIMGIFPYIVLFYIYGNTKTKIKVRIVLIIIVFYLLSQEFVMSLFDKGEASNSTKLGFFKDYSKVLFNFKTIIFGNGLDSYFYTSHRGRVNNTELTYIELFRRFGFFGAACYIYLMIRPAYVLLKRSKFKWLGLAYALYLIMIISNPFFFSSNGMTILSLVLVIYFRKNINSSLTYYKQ